MASLHLEVCYHVSAASLESVIIYILMIDTCMQTPEKEENVQTRSSGQSHVVIPRIFPLSLSVVGDLVQRLQQLSGLLQHPEDPSSALEQGEAGVADVFLGNDGPS
jgi:hypothetical protein